MQQVHTCSGRAQCSHTLQNPGGLPTGVSCRDVILPPKAAWHAQWTAVANVWHRRYSINNEFTNRCYHNYISVMPQSSNDLGDKLYMVLPLDWAATLVAMQGMHPLHPPPWQLWKKRQESGQTSNLGGRPMPPMHHAEWTPSWLCVCECAAPACVQKQHGR